MKKRFLVALLLFVCSLVYSQISKTDSTNIELKKAKLVSGLPANDFYNKFRNSSQIYSFAELIDAQEKLYCVLLQRKMKDSTTSFYLVYNKTENGTKVENINEMVRDNTSSVSFPLIQNGRDYILEFNSNVYDSIKFRYIKQKESPSYIPTEFRTHLDIECITLNINFQEHIGSSQYPPTYSEYSRLSTNFLIGYGFGLRIYNKHELIIRPAFAVFEKPFQGIELGLFYRFYLQNNIFGFIGYVWHSGTEGAHGTYNYQDGSGGYFVNYGIGYSFINRLAILINYSSVKHINARGNSFTYKTLFDQAGKEYLGNISTRKSWDWLLSIGLEFNY